MIDNYDMKGQKMNNPINFITDESQDELEKKMFGGDIYKKSHLLPIISIKKEQVDQFLDHVELIKDITEAFGRDLSLLFAEIYSIANPDKKEIPNTTLTEFCTHSLAILALALKQSQNLICKKSILQNDLEISGKEYCFITLFLNDIFYYYTTMINYIMNKRYLNENFLTGTRERICFIVSEEFEKLRKIFHVVECNMAIKTTETIH